MHYNHVTHPFASLRQKFIKIENFGGISSLTSYIKKHPDMLRYVFDEDQNLVKIIVDPNRFFTFKEDSKERLRLQLFGHQHLCGKPTRLLNMYLLKGCNLHQQIQFQAHGVEPHRGTNRSWCK